MEKRYNFEVQPGDKRLVEVKVDGRMATATIWLGTPLQATSLHYSFQFPGWPEDMEKAKRCEDAARVAVFHALAGDGIGGDVIHVVYDDQTERWVGQLVSLAG